MAVISKGTTFANGDQVTATKLNDLADSAAFVSGAVDNVSTQLSGGAIIVKDAGISTAKIADSNVTKAKIENVADYKVLGNVSGGSAAPAEVAILDEDNMSSNSATSLATQQSIKAYADSTGITQGTGSAPYFGCRAFGAFNGGASSPITPISSGNISSIVRNSTGNFTITLASAMPSANYSVIANEFHDDGVSFGTSTSVTIIDASSFSFRVGEHSGSTFNPDYIAFSVFG
tara:strand:+ start:2379 stop:3074 length:696 start_codon:yes stop_codon:yes gene_type:complete